MIQDLRHFLHPSPLPGHWLLIESSEYLPYIMEHYPAARLTSVESDPDIARLPRFAGCPVEWVIADFRTEPLPLARGSFDYALSAPLLTECYSPFETLTGVALALKDTGTLYTVFRNMRYAAVLDELRRGELPLTPAMMYTHYYTKPAMVRLLYHSMFREIVFAPGVQDEPAAPDTGRAGAGSAAPLSRAEQDWATAGWDDYAHDLATRTWLVRAGRSTAAVANLKSLYTPATRRQLARLLHRIEYDVDRDRSLVELRQLCVSAGIFPEYLGDFITEACQHGDRVRELL